MNVPKLKKQMREYALKYKLEIPKGFGVLSPRWGKPAQTLAWRVTTHMVKKGTLDRPESVTTSKVVLWELFNPKTFGQRVVELALAEVGVTEHPYASNDGPRVHQYQMVTGAFRQAWCASFVSFIMRHAGYKGRLPALPAWVPSWASAAGVLFTKVKPRQLKPGDYVTLWHNGHIEIFVGWKIPYVLAKCVGGNTSPVGKNANGGMVARTTRYVTEMGACGRVKAA